MTQVFGPVVAFLVETVTSCPLFLGDESVTNPALWSFLVTKPVRMRANPPIQQPSRDENAAKNPKRDGFVTFGNFPISQP